MLTAPVTTIAEVKSPAQVSVANAITSLRLCGTLDWQQLYAAIKAKTKAEYFVMEHDNPSDVDRFASRSITLAARGFVYMNQALKRRAEAVG